MEDRKSGRKFLNSMLSQARPAHLEDLIEYRRALRQRNEYLSTHPGPPADERMVAPLNAVLARFGGRIIARRSDFLEKFGEELRRAWKRLGEAIEEPVIRYQASVPKKSHVSAEEAEAALLSALENATSRDMELGRTTTGPASG